MWIWWKISQLIVIILMRSVQPKPLAIAIICKNGLSSASCSRVLVMYTFSVS